MWKKIRQIRTKGPARLHKMDGCIRRTMWGPYADVWLHYKAEIYCSVARECNPNPVHPCSAYLQPGSLMVLDVWMSHNTLFVCALENPSGQVFQSEWSAEPINKEEKQQSVAVPRHNSGDGKASAGGSSCHRQRRIVEAASVFIAWGLECSIYYSDQYIKPQIAAVTQTDRPSAVLICCYFSADPLDSVKAWIKYRWCEVHFLRTDEFDVVCAWTRQRTRKRQPGVTMYKCQR